MTLTFVHTGDWHIGKPFGRFPHEQASILRHARLTAIDRLAAVARAGGAMHVLVAGDLFDRPSLADRVLRAPLDQMRAHCDIVWHVIPGNHDPATPGGVWERVLRGGVPANVQVYLEARPAEIAEGCWLLPAPLSAKAMERDPTAWMDAAPTPAGAVRIGLAHGSIQGFGTESNASIEIAPDRPSRAGLGYLALGDWHGARQIGLRAWYSGTPEPDGFLDSAPGFALLVSLAGPDAPAAVTKREIGLHRWLERPINAARSSDLAVLEGEIEGLGARARHVLLAVEVTGRVSIEEDREIRARLDRLDSRVLHLARRFDRMLLGPVDDDFHRLGDGPLRELGRDLSAVAADPAHAESGIAARALRHLLDLADGTTNVEMGARA